MAFTRITDAQKNLPQLNKALSQVESLRQSNLQLQDTVNRLNQEAIDVELARQVERTNNITATWTGGTLTLSWNDSYTRDKQGNITRIPSGSRVVLASTIYWFAWNDYHNTMAINTDLQKINKPARNIVLFSVKTGTGAQTGTAGGGGSTTSGTDKNQVSYVLF